MKFSSVFTRLKGMPSVALLAMACSAFGGVASAAPFTWTGSSGSNSLWNTGSNWSGNGAGVGPGVTGSNLIFSGQLRTTNTNNLTLTTGSISFANTGSTSNGFVLTGSTVSLAANARISTAALTGTGTVLETIATDLKINGGGITLAPSGGVNRAHDLLISGNLSNGTGTVGNNVTISSGNGAQVFLSGNNTNVGSYTVNAGGILTTLGTSALNSQATRIDGTINANGGTLKLGPLTGSNTGVITTSTTGLQEVVVTQNGATTFNGSIQNGGGTLALTKNGTGNLTLTGSSNYTGATTINTGALTLGADASINGASAVTINSGTLNYGKTGATTFGNVLNGSGTSGVFNITSGGDVVISSVGNFGGTVNTGNSTATFTGNIGNATVNAEAGGTLYGTGNVGNVNAYDGSTVSAGLSHDVGKLTVANLTIVDATVTSVFDIKGVGTAAPLLAGTAGTDYDTIVGTGAIDYGATGSSLVFDFSSSTGDAFKDWSSFQLLSFANYSNFSSLDGSQLSTKDIGGAYDNLTFLNADQGRGVFIADAGNGQTVEFYAATGVLMIVPEPSSIILAGLGVGLAGFRTWRNRRLKAILNRAGSKV